MKRKLLFILICLILFTPKVKATIDSQYIHDMSADGYSITADAETGEVTSQLTMTLNYNGSGDNAYSYYVIFVENENSTKP